MSSGNGRRALVTGGAGFIGSHIVQRLLDEGWAVRVLDNFSSGREENLAEWLEQIELIRGDILDPDIVPRAVDGIEVVFHEAAIASVPRSVAEPIRTNDINGGGTLQVLECARQAGVRRVVFAASSAAYGNSKALPKRESMRPEPLSPCRHKFDWMTENWSAATHSATGTGIHWTAAISSSGLMCRLRNAYHSS